MTTHHLTLPFFTSEFFYQKQLYCRPQPSLLFSFSLIEEGLHFDAIEVIETESQAVLNTITEHDFQDA
jgi:hypothetical protein